MNGNLIGVPEAAKRLGVTESGIRAWIFQKRIPVVKLGSLVRIRRDILEKIEKQGLDAVGFQEAKR